jgi:hypothetical protein
MIFYFYSNTKFSLIKSILKKTKQDEEVKVLLDANYFFIIIVSKGNLVIWHWFGNKN